MPKLTIDATDAKAFEPIPSGTYDAKILEIADPKQGAKAQYINITFEIEDGEYVGRRVWRIFVIEGKGVVFLMDLIAKATGEAIEVGELTEFDTDDLLGKHVRVVVEEDEYEGKPKAEVVKILAPAA